VNIIPNLVVKLEKLYDLHDKFKMVTKCKINSSYMHFEVINLGIDISPHIVNLGTNCSPMENHAFIKLFREYKYIFAGTYDDLKTFDTKIIQRVIPMKPNTKLFQQN
jgi:hypothetical protein